MISRLPDFLGAGTTRPGRLDLLMRVLVATDSESGNTYEIALEVMAALEQAGCQVIRHRINGGEPLMNLPGIQLAFIGSYTWGYGAAPPSTEWFMEEHSFDCPVAAFGSGETQWGEEFFCGAVDLLRERYGSPFAGFKQEQMPNSRERAEIRAWTTEIVRQVQSGTETAEQEKYMAETVGFTKFEPRMLQGEWLVEFFKDDCVPCKMLGKTIDRLDGEANVLKVHLDGDSDFELAAGNYGVQSVPTLLFVRDGELLHQSAGFKSPADLARLLDQHFDSGKVAA